MAYSRRKLDRYLTALGYEERFEGTQDIRDAVQIVSDNPRASFGGEVYPTIADAVGGDPKQVERRIRAATNAAIQSPVWNAAWRGLAGTARPTNREVILRLARECDLED